jgi:DNA polymerase (family 10)
MITEPANNKVLASLFHKMADCYRYLGKDERFRALAYENVARILNNMNEDIALYSKDVKTLDAIGGIGERIAEKIIEYLHTGKIKTFEKLKKQVPYELLELMDITSIGPATLKTLHDELHIKNKDELIAAIESGRLSKLKGFGNKKIENISKSLKLIKAPQRLLLQEAGKIAEELIKDIRKITGVQKAEIAGSLRRKKETIGDIDIIILAEIKNRKKIVARFISLPQVNKVLVKGLTKASVILKYKNVQVDIRLVQDYEYGAAMLYFTGSKEHNIKLRTIAKQRGFKINEYGIFDAATGNWLAGKTEEEMYHFLKMKYIPPEQRLDKGEIEKAVIK